MVNITILRRVPRPGEMIYASKTTLDLKERDIGLVISSQKTTLQDISKHPYLSTLPVGLAASLLELAEHYTVVVLENDIQITNRIYPVGNQQQLSLIKETLEAQHR